MLACGYTRIAIAIKITKLLVKKDHVTNLEFYNIFFSLIFESGCDLGVHP